MGGLVQRYGASNLNLTLHEIEEMSLSRYKWMLRRLSQIREEEYQAAQEAANR